MSTSNLKTSKELKAGDRFQWCYSDGVPLQNPGMFGVFEEISICKVVSSDPQYFVFTNPFSIEPISVFHREISTRRFRLVLPRGGF